MMRTGVTSYKPIGLLLLAVVLVSCGPSPSPTGLPSVPPVALAETPGQPMPPTVAPITPYIGTSVLAPYRKEPVNVRPAVVHEPIAPDLGNVVSAFLLSPQQRERLAQQGFVVSPAEYKEFYILYEEARYNYEPTFITSDSLLHLYHLLFDKVLRTLERERFIPALQRLNRLMLEHAQQQYEQLRGTPLEESARRNVAYFAVGSRLLDPKAEIPAYAADLAEAELALIEGHSGIKRSPIFPALPYGEDYTQYIPRGHYTRGEDLKAYFRCMMWYGRMTFRILNPGHEAGREETRRALLIVQALASDATAQALWQSIYEPSAFFVGRSDDLLYSEYQAVMLHTYGGLPEPTAFADEERLTQFMQEAQKLRPPRILGIVIPAKADEEETTKGFRFMGQRFVPDAYILGQLVYDRVGKREPPDRRGLPKGLDLLAALGSARAYAILDEEGDTRFITYTLNLGRLRQEFSTITESEWTQNLYWSWLYLFLPLLEEPGEGYPAFMQSPAWLDKSLNTVLGSWAELRHDTILYVKQSYSAAEGGGKWPPTPELPKGYVEPVPEFYARLAALAKMTREGLQERGLLNSQDQESLQSLEDLSLALKRMAEKELAGQPLDEGEYVRILGYGRELENLTYAASDAPAEAGGYPVGGEDIQAAVIADVHTDPDPYGDNSLRAVVLEEGVGRIFTIYVVVPIEGELVVTKGGVFSYYEFPWPAGDRLTDEKWREMLDGGQAPALPGWTVSFRVEETEEAALRAAVWQFNEQWVAAAFMPDPTLLDAVATGEALTENRAYVQTLVEQKLYEGYHLVRLNYLSFDLQDAGRAIVTTRETWWDERYAVGAESWSGTLVARRPEYTIGVIYHLVRGEQGWLVSQVLLQGERPVWQAVTP